MAEPALKEVERRVDRLEEALIELAYQSRKTEMEIERLSQEMRDFKAEMRSYWEQRDKEWKEYKEQRDKEWKEYKEQRDNEWKEYKEQKDRELKEMNKKWGDLVNKWGTMVEDIIVPGIPFALERRFGLIAEDIIAYRRKRLKGREREYDVIVVTGDYVFVFDVKSRYREKHFEKFEEALGEFFEYFPELRRYKLIPVISAFNFDEGTINTATKRGWLALQMSGDYLDFVNAEQVKLPT